MMQVQQMAETLALDVVKNLVLMTLRRKTSEMPLIIQ